MRAEIALNPEDKKAVVEDQDNQNDIHHGLALWAKEEANRGCANDESEDGRENS
jgi:hypothetical protein